MNSLDQSILMVTRSLFSSTPSQPSSSIILLTSRHSMNNANSKFKKKRKNNEENDLPKSTFRNRWSTTSMRPNRKPSKKKCVKTENPRWNQLTAHYFKIRLTTKSNPKNKSFLIDPKNLCQHTTDLFRGRWRPSGQNTLNYLRIKLCRCQGTCGGNCLRRRNIHTGRWRKETKRSTSWWLWSTRRGTQRGSKLRRKGGD